MVPEHGGAGPDRLARGLRGGPALGRVRLRLGRGAMTPLMIAAVLAGTLVVFGYLVVIWWLDRYEREPFWMTLLVFAWGGFGGTSMGCLCSIPFVFGATAAGGAELGQASQADLSRTYGGGTWTGKPGGRKPHVRGRTWTGMRARGQVSRPRTEPTLHTCSRSMNAPQRNAICAKEKQHSANPSYCIVDSRRGTATKRHRRRRQPRRLSLRLEMRAQGIAP